MAGVVMFIGGLLVRFVDDNESSSELANKSGTAH
jgi:hypothetical protein